MFEAHECTAEKAGLWKEREEERQAARKRQKEGREQWSEAGQQCSGQPRGPQNLGTGCSLKPSL